MIVGIYNGYLTNLAVGSRANNIANATDLLSFGISYHHRLNLLDTFAIATAQGSLQVLADIGFFVGLHSTPGYILLDNGTDDIGSIDYAQLDRATQVAHVDCYMGHEVHDYTDAFTRAAAIDAWWGRQTQPAAHVWPRLYYGNANVIYDRRLTAADFGRESPHIVHVGINSNPEAASISTLKLADRVKRVRDTLDRWQVKHKLWTHLNIDDGETQATCEGVFKHIVSKCRGYIDCFIIRSIDDPSTGNSVPVTTNALNAWQAVVG